GGIADALAEHDYDLLLAHAPVEDVLALKESSVMRQSDGTIFIGQAQQHEKLNTVAAGDTHMVVWGYPVQDKNYVVVGGDNIGGGYEATKHLLDLGRRQVAFFGSTKNPENAARYEGHLKALREYGIDADRKRKIDVPFEMHRAREVIIEMLESGVELDSVVCISDVMALATISTLQEYGLHVPKDVAVVGYDDISLAAYSNPPLTTIRQNIRHAGRILVESVLGQIRGEHVPDTMVTSDLVIRKSSGAG
ncbi:MAG: substrate-binding domain-containing protein, partial [Gammaproteobacteria bacterium]|nr:substrate-binding domain-containing protein [Gammaproteobacteria bacterium]